MNARSRGARAAPGRGLECAARAAAWGCALAVTLPVAFLVGYLVYEAGPALGGDLFFGDVPALAAILGQRPVWDGIWPACAGTLALVALTSAMAVPLGVAGGISLSLFARGRLRRLLRLGVDVLAGIPSILMGLFGFALILFLRRAFLPQANTCLLLAAVSMALLILPYVVGATAGALDALPDAMRLLGPSLGLSTWRTVAGVLVPEARRGILGGIILAVGRACEDTAVILMTGVVVGAGLPSGLFGKFEALPFYIYYTSAQYQTPDELNRVYGAALVLLCLAVGLFLCARLGSRLVEGRYGMTEAMR